MNFFVGENNVGKTTFLEAVYGWASGYNVSPFWGTGVQRNQFAQNSTAYQIAENIVSAMNDKGNIPFSFQFIAKDDGREIEYSHKISLGDVFRDFIRDVAMDTSSMNEMSLTGRGLQAQVVTNTPIARCDIRRNGDIKRSILLEWPNIFSKM